MESKNGKRKEMKERPLERERNGEEIGRWIYCRIR